MRELQKTKPDKWGYGQDHELWSPKEENTCVLDTVELVVEVLEG